jgi:RNAse (barnase) inhibitor barstar
MNLIIKDKNYKSLSPCIISWAKYALKIKFISPNNNKKCSKHYWIYIIDYLLKKQAEFEENRLEAINKFNYVKR